jgi:hypothetical protein
VVRQGAPFIAATTAFLITDSAANLLFEFPNVWLRKKALSGSATDYAFSSPHLDTIEHLTLHEH